ncbi:hypothetical protein [Hymenobacter sp. B81]|uniref:hypothetical protein n=1 Tax=Hymenobacter sp. B81 TaxID=3344878 RepID=UPI0037DDBD0C
MEPDTVLVQEGAVVTDEKDAEQLALETAIQQVLGIIAVKDSARTSRYKRFGVANVTALSESKLHLAATLLVKQGRKYLSEYAAEGLTEDLLQTVETCNAAFVDGLAERKEAENARRVATQTRIVFANGLYRQLVQLCAAGESVYKLTDAARARDYVIDPVPVTGGPRPVVAEAKV